MAQETASLLLYLNTIRYFKLSQILWRLWYRYRAPRVSAGPPGSVRPRDGRWHPPVIRRGCMSAPDVFTFLNHQQRVAFPQGWNDHRFDKLWLYNLHYFDDLGAEEALERRTWHEELIARWIRENPPVCGNGWEPYPVSLRIVNWIKWSLSGQSLPQSGLDSLALQARFLRGRLEYHVRANHLFANAKSLIFAGLFFEGSESEEWLRKGRALLRGEIAEQLLADGGHFELSPMYHCIILEDVLDLINVHHAYSLDVPVCLHDAARRMMAWLRVMCHPDGDTPLFNDAAFGVAPTPQALFDYGKRLDLVVPEPANRPLERLDDSGYVRMSKGPAVVLCDVADVLAAYQPGHTHADTFTFEMSLFGRRLLVDTGTCLYKWSDLRASQRATAAHNTLSVDGQDSSEVWRSFRVGRRARIRSRWYEATDRLSVEAVHDGFSRLPGVGDHRRRWTLDELTMEIMDEVTGVGIHIVELFFQLHPDIAIAGDGAVYYLTDQSGRILARFFPDPALDVTLSRSKYSPEFGVQLPNTRITARYEGPLPMSFHSRFEWDRTSL